MQISLLPFIVFLTKLREREVDTNGFPLLFLFSLV